VSLEILLSPFSEISCIKLPIGHLNYFRQKKYVDIIQYLKFVVSDFFLSCYTTFEHFLGITHFIIKPPNALLFHSRVPSLCCLALAVEGKCPEVLNDVTVNKHEFRFLSCFIARGIDAALLIIKRRRIEILLRNISSNVHCSIESRKRTPFNFLL
jgi:hypothetical protein